MKKILNVLKTVGLYIWQLPQNLVGLILLWYYKPIRKHVIDGDVEIYFTNKFPGGISLGKYSIVKAYHYRVNINDSLKRDTVRHEAIGHAKQSKYLGPLYLFVIGIPSIIWAGLYGTVVKNVPGGYYWFYTEKWADKLAGVKR